MRTTCNTGFLIALASACHASAARQIKQSELIRDDIKAFNKNKGEQPQTPPPCITII